MNPHDIRKVGRKQLAALFDFAVAEDDPETAQESGDAEPPGRPQEPAKPPPAKPEADTARRKIPFKPPPTGQG